MHTHRVVCQAIAREHVLARRVVPASDFGCAFPHNLSEVSDHAPIIDGSGGRGGPEVVANFSIPIAHHVGVADRHCRARSATPVQVLARAAARVVGGMNLRQRPCSRSAGSMQG